MTDKPRSRGTHVVAVAFSVTQRERSGSLQAFPKIRAGRNFLNVTDHHAHPGVLFRFRETPSLAVLDHAHPGVSGVIFGKFCNTFHRKGTTKKLCVTKILPNVRENFLVQFSSNPFFYWVMTDKPLELFRKFFGAVRAIFIFFGVLFWLLFL